MNAKSLLRVAVSALALGALSACTVGPDYKRPDAPPAPRFKEADGWQPAHPVDAIDKGAWWSVFQDPELDALEKRVAIDNQTVAEAVATYRQAVQLTKATQSTFFPTLTANASVTDAKSGVSTGTSRAVTTYSGALEAAWAPDLWGSIRRQVENQKATAQADAALIANARLSEQALLATNYFELRIADAQMDLFRQTVSDFQKFLTLTQNQYTAGTQSRAAVITAQTQLLGAQAELKDLENGRATNEHAIAMLVGVAPSELSIAPIHKSQFDVPVAPTDIPSTLLERRPDIAAAERQAKAANALIGVQEAAFYPTLNLTGQYGYNGTSLGRIFNASNELWSVGGSLAETLVDFGERRANVRAARAQYDAAIANYRQSVLVAFQGVEDNLAALRVLQQEAVVRQQALDAANQAVTLDINLYKAGTQDYTTVITAQATALSDGQTVLQVQQARLLASINLIQDLGGGWQAGDLPQTLTTHPTT